eukprot:16676-Heterococcus_DN1.PRE.4
MALLREHVFTADLIEGEEERQRARLSLKHGVGRLVGARLPEGCLGMLEHRGIASITVTGAEAYSRQHRHTTAAAGGAVLSAVYAHAYAHVVATVDAAVKEAQKRLEQH